MTTSQDPEFDSIGEAFDGPTECVVEEEAFDEPTTDSIVSASLPTLAIGAIHEESKFIWEKSTSSYVHTTSHDEKYSNFHGTNVSPSIQIEEVSTPRIVDVAT